MLLKRSLARVRCPCPAHTPLGTEGKLCVQKQEKAALMLKKQSHRTALSWPALHRSVIQEKEPCFQLIFAGEKD